MKEWDKKKKNKIENIRSPSDIPPCLSETQSSFFLYRWEEEVLREGLPPSVSEVSKVQQTTHSWTTCRGKRRMDEELYKKNSENVFE